MTSASLVIALLCATGAVVLAVVSLAIALGHARKRQASALQGLSDLTRASHRLPRFIRLLVRLGQIGAVVLCLSVWVRKGGGERARRARDHWLARAGLLGQLDGPGFRALQVGSLLAWLGGCVLLLAVLARTTTIQVALLVTLGVLACAVGALMPVAWVTDRIKQRERAMLRDLPFALQLATLGLQAGMSLSASLALAVEKLPAGALLDWMQRLLARIQAGQTPASVLRELSQEVHVPAIQSWAAAVAIAQWQGASLAEVFRHQAQQVSTDRFVRAERLALEAPIKLLFPLAVFVFPSAFIVLFYPVIIRLLQEGFL